MAEKEVKPFSHSHNLEQYVLLAKSARGAGLVALINQTLEAPGVYVFGELIEMPSVKALENSENASYWNLLNIFAFGTYSDYKEKANLLPALTASQLRKLQHLTIVSLAAKSKFIPYSLLLQELDIKNLRELEDVIIDAIYADIIHGKLDQKNKQLEVDFAIGRDITPETVNRVTEVLQDWCDGCESVLRSIEKQIERANTHKEKKQKQKVQVEAEVENLRKAIKASSQSDMNNGGVSGMPASYHSQQYQQKAPTTSRTKGLLYLTLALLDIQTLNFFYIGKWVIWGLKDKYTTTTLACLVYGRFARHFNFVLSPLDYCFTWFSSAGEMNFMSVFYVDFLRG